VLRHVIDPARVNMKHLAVQEQQRTERLIRCRRADLSVDRQVGQIPADLVAAHPCQFPCRQPHQIYAVTARLIFSPLSPNESLTSDTVTRCTLMLDRE
jgi:hypothetical protein